MRINYVKKIFCILFAIYFIFGLPKASAENLDVAISISPRTGSFVEGSTFEVPILIDTKGKSINGIEIRINFDKERLSIVNPSSGTSIIGIWVETPGYDNTLGTLSYVGIVPNGVTTQSGLIGTISFKAKKTGSAMISIDSSSKILLNDGLGTEADIDFGSAEYNVLPKSPEGVRIFSETHPVQSDWYNNNSPIISWIKDSNVSGFSFILDNKPNTIPDNTIDSTETTKIFVTLNDGLYYFHIKANKNGMWGSTGHFLMRIDTASPAEFKPETNYLVTEESKDRTLLSFFTTDNLSGMDHYEVGVIDRNQPLTEFPVFVEAQSPFQVPVYNGSNLEVIVRAIDKAGNVRDETINVKPPFIFAKFFKDYPIYILLGIIFLGLTFFILHFFIGHHVARYIAHVIAILKKEKMK